MFLIVIVTMALSMVSVANASENAVGLRWMANNNAITSLRAVDTDAVELSDLTSDLTQSISAFASFRWTRVQLGAEVTSLTPEMGDFSGISDHWFGKARFGFDLVSSEEFDLVAVVEGRDSADSVQGYEDLEGGTLGAGLEATLRW